jgi:hypothetical protein
MKQRAPRVDNIRQIEPKIQDLVINKGGMPRPDFIQNSRRARRRCADRRESPRYNYCELWPSTGRRSSSSGEAQSPNPR